MTFSPLTPSPPPRLLSQRMFIRLWLTRVMATASLQMLVLSIGWLMYDLTRDAWDLGLIGIYQFLPALVMTLPAGQAVDRFHRGAILSACVALQAVTAGVLLYASLRGGISRELLLGAAMGVGVARAFQSPAQQALIAVLVPRALMPRATAMSSGGGQAANMLGPAIGGLLLIFGPVAVFFCCLALQVLGLGLGLSLRYKHSPDAREPVTLISLLAGVRFVLGHRIILGALSLDLFAVLLGGATALLPMFARDILMVDSAGLGLLRAAPAVGALAMSLVLSRFSLDRHIGLKLIGAVTTYALAMLVFGLSPYFALSLAALILSGCADMVSAVIRHTLVQMETPDAMRGRVGAVNAIFIGASNQLGEFESGATASWLGPVGSVVMGSAATLCLVVLWLRVFPDLVRRDRFDHSSSL